MLDAPNLNCAPDDGRDYYDETDGPVSLPCGNRFGHRRPHYQSQNAPIKGERVTKGEQPVDADNLVKWKGVVFSAERDLIDNDAQILNIELNRGWNSRLGFSLQEVDGCTCVSAVYQDSVAARDGRIKTGDCLLRVRYIFYITAKF